MLKALMFSLAVILQLAFGMSTALAQDSLPISPLVIRMLVSDMWFLSITSTGEKTTSMVVYEVSGLLNTTRATIAVKECDKVAGAIEAAADAVQGGKPIGVVQFGDLHIGIKSNPEGHKSVTLSGGEKGLMFTSPLEQFFTPVEAKRFAKSLRAVPGIEARLMSHINFAAIWKSRR